MTCLTFLTVCILLFLIISYYEKYFKMSSKIQTCIFSQYFCVSKIVSKIEFEYFMLKNSRKNKDK